MGGAKFCQNCGRQVATLDVYLYQPGVGDGPPGRRSSQTWYVKKQVLYVMGRPAGVAPFQADGQQAKVPAGPRS